MSQFSAPRVRPMQDVSVGQTRELAQGIADAGVVARRIGRVVQGQVDDAAIAGNLARFSNFTRHQWSDSKTGYKFLPDPDVEAQFPTVVEATEAEFNRLRDSLDNDYQRQEFARRAEPERQRFLELAHGHRAAAAERTFVVNTEALRESHIESAIGYGPDDDDSQSWEEAVAAQTALNRQLGLTGPAAEAELQKVRRRMAVGHVSTLLQQKQWDRARDYMERAAAAGNLSPEQHAAARKLVQDHVDQEQAYQAADDLRRRFPGQLGAQLEAMESLPAAVRDRAQSQAAFRARQDEADRQQARVAAVDEAVKWQTLNPGAPLPPELDYKLDTTPGARLDYDVKRERGDHWVMSPQDHLTVATLRHEARTDPRGFLERFPSPGALITAYQHDLPPTELRDLVDLHGALFNASQEADAKKAAEFLKTATKTTIDDHVPVLVRNTLKLALPKLASDKDITADEELYNKQLGERITLMKQWLQGRVREEQARRGIDYVSSDMLNEIIAKETDGLVVTTPIGRQWFPHYMLTPADRLDKDPKHPSQATDPGYLQFITPQGNVVDLNPLTLLDPAVQKLIPAEYQTLSIAELVELANMTGDDDLQLKLRSTTAGGYHVSGQGAIDPVTGERLEPVRSEIPPGTGTLSAAAGALAVAAAEVAHNRALAAAMNRSQAVLAAKREARKAEMALYYQTTLEGTLRARASAAAQIRERRTAQLPGDERVLAGLAVLRDMTLDEVFAHVRATTLAKFKDYQRAYAFDDLELDVLFGKITAEQAEQKRRVRDAMGPFPGGGKL